MCWYNVSSLVANSSHHFLILNFHRYPADDDLPFEKFKSHKNWIDATTLDTDAGDALKAIMWSRFSLAIFKDETKDFLQNVGTKATESCSIIPAALGLLPNPAFIVCWVIAAIINAIAWVVYWVAKIA